MSRFSFAVGAAFQWDGEAWQIARRLPDEMLNIESKRSGQFKTVNMDMLRRALFSGAMRFIGNIKPKDDEATEDELLDSIKPAMTFDDYEPHLQAKAEYREWAIAPLLAMGGNRKRSDVEARVAEVRQIVADSDAPVQQRQLKKMPKLSASVMTFYRWINVFVDSGFDRVALIGDSRKQGRHGRTKFPVQVEKIIRDTIEEKALSRKRYTIDDMFHEILLRVDRYNERKGKSYKAPSRTTVSRRIDELGYWERFAARNGARRGYYAKTQFDEIRIPERPLGRVEIDHTQVDLIVVDPETGAKLGRPYLTMCIDVTTRMPLGYYLGFDKPSYRTVMECLYHAIMPKDYVQELYGTTNTWDVYGVPRILVIDNGKEFKGKSLKDACKDLHIIIQETPAYTPHLKAFIERQFKSLNTNLIHKLDGTTMSNVAQRGDYKSMEEAVHTLGYLDKLIHEWLVDQYSQDFHTGMQGIPARRWQAYRNNGFEPQLPESAERLAIELGAVKHRKVKSKGIELFGLWYQHPDLSLLRAELKGTDAKIKYHPGDLGRIHVFDPFENRYIEVPARNQSYANGLSHWQHRVIRRFTLDEKNQVDHLGLAESKSKVGDMVDASLNGDSKSSQSRAARWKTSGKNARTMNAAENDASTNESMALPASEDVVEIEQPKPSSSAENTTRKRKRSKRKFSFSPDELAARGMSADEDLPTVRTNK